MAFLTPLPAAPADAPAAALSAKGPACSLQRVAPQGAPGKAASLWQLGIEAQELTTAIGHLAEQLETDATCWVIEHLRGQAAYRQQQAKRLAALAAGDTSRADALEESLVFVLTQLQPAATRFSFPNHELSSRTSQAVVIEDEQALDPEWLATTTTTTSKPDKAAIKEALKAGRHIEGAQLLSRRSWRIQ